MNLIKPSKLNRGDKIATVSLSWGIAGEPDARWCYDLAIKRMKEIFELECVAAPNSMRGEKYLEENVEARAEDLCGRFLKRTLKGLSQILAAITAYGYYHTFGHTSPICALPYGSMAEIDCENALFSILESEVVSCQNCRTHL